MPGSSSLAVRSSKNWCRKIIQARSISAGARPTISQSRTLKTGDPRILEAQIDSFIADHFALCSKITTLVYDKETFEGGEDHTQCHYGQWAATQKLDNPELLSIIRQTEEPHARFHEAVRKVKQLVKEGNSQAAIKTYKNELLPAMHVLVQLLAIRELGNKPRILFAKAHHQLMEVCRESQLKANDLLERLAT